MDEARPCQIEKFHVSLGKQIDLNSLVEKQRCKGDLSLLMRRTVDLVPTMIPVCPSTEVLCHLLNWWEWILLTVIIATGIMSHFCLPCGWTWLISWISEVPGQIPLFTVIFSVFSVQNWSSLAFPKCLFLCVRVCSTTCEKFSHKTYRKCT